MTTEGMLEAYLAGIKVLVDEARSLTCALPVESSSSLYIFKAGVNHKVKSGLTNGWRAGV